MLLSPLRITWNPGSIVLLDYGDETAEYPVVVAAQDASVYTPLGQVWGNGQAEGGLRRSYSFSRVLTHASRAVAEAYQQEYPGSLPFAQAGTLTVQVQGGRSFTLATTVLLAAVPRILPDRGNCTETLFRLSSGKLTRL